MAQTPPPVPGQGTELSRRSLLGWGVAGAGAVALGATTAAPAAAAPPPGAGAGPLAVGRPRTEYADHPLGTDVAQPRFSWTGTAPGHGATQSAYQVLVATSPDRLTSDTADVWDSGRVVSPRSVGVAYDGPRLAPRTRYHWTVRLWDGAGRESGWSTPTWFETGLLDEGFGAARWVGAKPDVADAPLDVAGASWIWSPGATASNAPVGARWFRGRLAVPAGVEIAVAYLVVTADDDFAAYLDGRQVLHAPQESDGWQKAKLAEVTELARAAAGRTLTLAAVAVNRPGATVNPAGLLAKLVVVTSTGERLVLVTDGSWRSSDTEQPGWQEAGYDDAGWAGVAVLAPYGQGPWSSNVTVPQPHALDLAGASWVWGPGATVNNAPAGPRWFRGRLALPAGLDVTSARLIMSADDDFTVYLAGQLTLSAPQQTDGWRTGRVADVTELARGAVGGDLVLAVIATNRPGPSVNPGGLIAKLVVRTADSQELVLVTAAGWRTTGTLESGWEQPGHDDGGWSPVVVLAPYGQGPWGSGIEPPVQERPAPVLRRAFRLTKPVARARLYASGLAYQVLHLNGKRVGDAVLDPGFTDYADTVLYATHDVTDLLTEGQNVLGGELGRGFYGMITRNVWRWQQPPWHGEPRLLARLVVDHPDGSRTEIVSDDAWRVSDGPTLSNSLYEGETYDARREPAGWSTAGFDDSEWDKASVLEAPAGTVRAQEHEPIRVVESVAPVRLTSPTGGVWVADFGRTTAGWVRLNVTAPAGTTIRILYGEKLRADGTVEAANGNVLTARFQQDEYVARGGGEEVWEPRFSYKGFRYVQLDGLPGAATTGTVTMQVVHSDVRDVGEFHCSEPLFEQFERMMRRTVRNNLHGIPTDTPMYEKNGWTGDAQVAAPTMAGLLDLSRFFTKWLGDLRDSQVSSGQVPVIVPSGGWGYQELAPAPEWTTVYPFLLREMHRWYGDDRLLRQHWEPVNDYLEWELGRLRDGLAVTALGDYLSPGTGGNPPEDTRLTATAYLYRALVATAEVGELTGQDAQAARFRTAAAGLRDRLNETFLDRARGLYRTARDPGYRQTSNAVPLAFGLVPDDLVGAVVDNLVADIRERGWHLNTGCLGTSVLLPVLTERGHADVAARVALQRTYPSWGYWVDNGADTMWEMWPTSTRSRQHYFHGTVVQWLYQHVAGLRPIADGWGSIVVRPDARAELSAASAAVDTVRGRASSAWRLQEGAFELTVQVPVGATAEVHVPAARAEDVEASPGGLVTARRMADGYLVHTVGSGTWRFVSSSAPTA
ncbi:glycoside hydrolase family 78 protein [Micromonospora sp. MA102]|uniref:glycoside hydrolase family 78 protein n=1 Tax=Micromonospora sp. MA102 TaxID=2952755 RepID=UPI0021C761FE|nr:glycoside hydrolase family 78 protein [Micromonospora sp. MA102]